MAGAVSFGAGAVRVEGLGDFQRALKELDVSLQRQLHDGLLEAAAPVADAAAVLALKGISGMKYARNSAWWEMRVGQSPGLVYIAPKQRGRKRGGSKRPNLAGLLVVKAMEPAAEQQHERVQAAVESTLAAAFAKAGL